VGRRSVWSDPEVIAKASEFLPAADEVWRLQRGSDLECQIFQEMANSGHYQGKGGTRQGIYVLSPSGRLLASANVLNPLEAKLLMERGLKAWKALPPSHRELDPRAASKGITRWEDSYPHDGLALRITLRELPKSGDPMDERKPPANRDHAWFSRTEARAWLPARLEVGAHTDLPRPLFERLACLHLVDAVRGQGLPYAPEEIEAGSLRSEVTARDGDLVHVAFRGEVSMRARGPWLLGENDWTPNAEYPRSIQVELLGSATFDTAAESFTDFELVATGARRGRSQFNGRSGPDDTGLIGFVFEPARSGPSSKVPPAFIDLYRQFGAEWVRAL